MSQVPERANTPAPHRRILIGFLAGAGAGLLVEAFARGPDGGAQPWVGWVLANVAEPAGRIFLRLLLMTVVPLVVASLTLGVAGLGDPRKLGRVGLKTLVLTLFVSAVSVGIGLGLANAIHPGGRVPAQVRDQLFAAQRARAVEAVAKARAGGERTFGEAVVDLVPDNPVAAAARTPPDMLALMVFSVVLGIGLALSKEKGRPLTELLESLFAVLQKVIALILWLAPFGVAALLFTLTARFGFGVVRGLAAFVGTVLAGLLLHQLVVYSLVLRLLGKVSPWEFFRRIRLVMTTAFATSSSNATLPTSLQAAEQRLHLPRDVSSFVLTVGATANQNGTALYEGVTVLFLAQVFGVDLSLGQQLGLMGLAVVAGIGTAGVPSASIPFIVMILGTVGVPPEGIGIILGVDRFLDMCRTVPNVTGDLVVATLVARSEGAEVMRPETPEASARG